MIENYIYWISTALLSLLYFASALMYIAKGDFVRNAQAELGYSASHLVPLMIVVKILGPVAILWRFNVAISDLAYAGMLYHLLLSASAHLGVHKPKGSIPAAVGIILLATSFVTQNVAREYPSPYAPVTIIQEALK
ncbi:MULTISPECIES: DoxX family protein [Pseudomonas]|uniref:DoxX-like family n=2 Tax=Pseudomonas TaxID=286 RepID=A0AA94JFY9_9PSED|nr:MULTISPECIES: DoxX family protein [Pseudomonas]MBT9263370.1 DoxX family protein [Pseudomonas sp. MG-9]RVD75707.1 DoxX-like family [Pseudomonas koreensis]WDR37825.1 DoxX family protein [Pseudomonas serboccidentalis]